MAVYQIKKGGFFSGLSLTTKLIILNIIFYFVGIFIFAIYGDEFVLNNLAIKPSLILSGKNLWTIITSMFMHAGLFHIFANMFSLFFVGKFLEKIIGKTRFFSVYIASGIVGGLFFVFSSLIFGNLDASAVGASGAIFGLLGVLAVLVPFSRVYLIAGPLIIIVVEVLFSPLIPESMLSIFSFLINFLIIVMIFSLFSFNKNLRRIAVPVELPLWLLPIIAIVPLTIIGYFVPLPIGNSAHIGGLLTGMAYAFYLRYRFPNKTQNLRRLFK